MKMQRRILLACCRSSLLTNPNADSGAKKKHLHLEIAHIPLLDIARY